MSSPMSTERVATARACANIALVKYWGKRDGTLNLPQAGSLSLTLDGLVTVTTVAWTNAIAHDTVELGGQPASAKDATRVLALIQDIRRARGISAHCLVRSTNRFPTASGLASSASGFAALVLAALHADGGNTTERELSVWARRGSGSAARSLFGGLVRMHPGERADGEDAFATRITGAPAGFVDDLRMIVAVVGGGTPKTHGSRDAMNHSAATSPLHDAWVALVPRDLARAEAAIAGGDLRALGEVAEANALAMHATAMAARPAIIYWQPATLAALAEVRALRARGVDAWATMDAGPHVKVLTRAADAAAVTSALAQVPGVDRTITCQAGPDALVALGPDEPAAP